MARKNSVWGIDVGQGALKAIKLRGSADGNHQLQEFEVIEHSQILTHAGGEAPRIIQETLDAFLARHDVTDSQLAVSVLGQTSFTRFVKLPPVEKKKIPDIVRFEAEQQIPFPIDDVTWRWQTFLDPDSPDIEVGIFAMKQADVSEMLSYFVSAGIDVDLVQMAPLALYNMMVFDEQVADDGATLLVDVGADKTHLVIADGSRTWTRTIQIGGNSFTEALVKSFKLPFAKAEKLKRTAASSKYARQIFQVMRPVFADMVQEIQRTIGHYTQRHRESRFSLLLGTGNGFRLPGMQKYLEQNLNMNVRRIDSYTHIADADEDFQSNSLSMGVAIGLAAQALSDAPVETNLLPESIVGKRRWASKKPWFAAAAAALVVAAGLYPLNAMSDRSKLESEAQQEYLDDTKSLVSQWERWERQQREVGGNVEQQQEEILEILKLRAYASIQPRLSEAITRAFLRTQIPPQDQQILDRLPAATPQEREARVARLTTDQALLSAISLLPYTDAPEGETTLRQRLIERLADKPRAERDILVIEAMPCTYVANIVSSDMARQDPDEPRQESEAKRGYELSIECRTPLSIDRASRLQTVFRNTLIDQINADPNFELVDISLQALSAKRENTASRRRPRGEAVIYNPGDSEGRPQYGPTGPEEQEDVFEPVVGDDPTFITEMRAQDVRFSVDLKIAVVGDGLDLPNLEDDADEQGDSRRKRR
jgi:type IV pilus assembly protein PilM